MKLSRSSQFNRDTKRMRRQGKNLRKIDNIVKNLLEGKKLQAKYSDHKLRGRLKKYRECHIEPNWLLIYRLTKEVLWLERTGSHSELLENY